MEAGDVIQVDAAEGRNPDRGMSGRPICSFGWVTAVAEGGESRQVVGLRAVDVFRIEPAIRAIGLSRRELGWLAVRPVTAVGKPKSDRTKIRSNPGLDFAAVSAERILGL